MSHVHILTSTIIIILLVLCETVLFLQVQEVDKETKRRADHGKKTTVQEGHGPMKVFLFVHSYFSTFH